MGRKIDLSVLRDARRQLQAAVSALKRVELASGLFENTDVDSDHGDVRTAIINIHAAEARLKT